jgi:hypothetical protein
MRAEPDPCPSCGHTEPKWKTVYPVFRNHPDLERHFLDLQKTLRSTYTLKHQMKAAMGILGEFPQSEETEDKVKEQGEILLEHINDIESYFIDIVIEMYVEKNIKLRRSSLPAE